MTESEMMKKRKLPLFLITPGSMSKDDIARAERDCGIVIVESEKPDAVRLLEPPIDADLDAQAWAALSLMRSIIDDDSSGTAFYYKHTLVTWFTQRLMNAHERPRTVPKVPKK